MALFFKILGVSFALSLVPLVVLLARSYARFWKQRAVACPIVKATGVVQLEAARAAWTSVTGDRELHVAWCSQWPKRQDCGRECLAEIEARLDWEARDRSRRIPRTRSA